LLLREVAAQVELSVPTVMATHRADLAGGWVAVNVKPRGRNLGEGRQLTPEQETQIRRLI
ncbi:IS630 family transposase, partial [Pelomicrobium sp. G1]